ncbi:putative ribonuclease H-like domain-containing protein [Tanacetum coccineum]
MQEELLQFKLQQVWILVDLPFRKKAIGTKWVFRNKRDERSIVVKNKARLIAQGHRQEEGIDYDEVFAPVARIKAIRLILAFASYMGFLVYQMDVKSVFLYDIIEEEVYVHQPSGFVDPAHPNKVYKVVKALYGLHQAPRAWYETLSSFLLENGFRRGTIDKTLFIKKNKSDIMLVQVYVDDIIFGSTKKSMCTEFEEVMHKRFQMSSMGELTFFLGLQVKQQPDGIFISQDKYVADILKKFDFCSIKIATTPIESNKPLVKDEDGVEVDVHEYRSMIGSLMYLTTSRPDIMFAVCACARFQVTPKASHLHAVKRIFRYLKHQPKLGLWYPRDSPFELEAFSDSDYAGASLDKKSTTEYVAAAHCCGQVLWIQNQMMDYGFNFMNTKIHIDNESTICVVKNPVYHSRTKHIEIRHHFIRDCYEKRLIDVLKIHTDSNVADLLTKGFDVTRISMDLRMDRCSAGKFYSYMVLDFLTVHALRSYAAPLFEGNTLGSAEDSMQLKELMVLVPILVTRINSLEKELKDTKHILGDAVVKLAKKVKSVETALKRKSKRVIVSESESEEPEDKERIIQDIDDNPLVSLVKESMKEKPTNFVTPTKASGEAQKEDISPTILEAAKTLSKVASQGVSKEKSTDKGKRYRRRARSVAKNINIGLDAKEEINTGIKDVNTGSTKVDSGTASKRGQREESSNDLKRDIRGYQKPKEQEPEEARLAKEAEKQKEALSEQQQDKGKSSSILKLNFILQTTRMHITQAKSKLQSWTQDVLGNRILPEQAFAKRMAKLVTWKLSVQASCRFDDKDVPAIGENVAEVKEEDPVKRTGKRNKQKARKGIHVDKSAQEDSETDKEESVEAMNPTPLTTKSDVCFGAMVKDFTREDLIELYRTMFDPPLNEDAIWSLPLQQKMVSWRYYDKCEVHCLTLEACTIYMLADRKYPLSKEACQVMLKMKLLDGKMNEVCYKLLKMIEKQAGIRK